MLLGEGNDRLTITSTLVAGPDRNPDGTPGAVAVHGGITTVHGGGNSRLEVRGTFTVSGQAITRTDGVAWASAGLRRRPADHRRTASPSVPSPRSPARC